jgi:hypothetical protein
MRAVGRQGDLLGGEELPQLAIRFRVGFEDRNRRRPLSGAQPPEATRRPADRVPTALKELARCR